jgi:hypothetical protein
MCEYVLSANWLRRSCVRVSSGLCSPLIRSKEQAGSDRPCVCARLAVSDRDGAASVGRPMGECPRQGREQRESGRNRRPDESGCG